MENEAGTDNGALQADGGTPIRRRRTTESAVVGGAPDLDADARQEGVEECSEDGWVASPPDEDSTVYPTLRPEVGRDG